MRFDPTKKLKKYVSFFLLGVAVVESAYLGYIYREAKKEASLKNGTLCAQKTRPERYDCWQTSIETALKNKGVDAALDVVANFYAAQPEFASDCHAFVHIIGNEAARLFLAHKPFTLTPKISYCAYGFFHGFLEAFLQEGGTFSEARAFCKFAAGQLQTLYQAEDSCYHGVGHGVTDGSDPHAWGNAEEIIKPGLLSCAKIAPGSEQLKSCATGVFNALAIMMMERKNRLFPPKNPYEICLRQKQPEYRRACYEQMNTLALYVGGGQFARAISFILPIADKEQQQYALFSLAAMAAGENLRKENGEDAAAAQICRTLARQELRTDCIKGFMGGLMEHGKPGYEYERAHAFCLLPFLNEEEKNGCIDFLMVYARSLYSFEKMQEVCAVFDDSWRVRCAQYAAASFGKFKNK